MPLLGVGAVFEHCYIDLLGGMAARYKHPEAKQQSERLQQKGELVAHLRAQLITEPVRFRGVAGVGIEGAAATTMVSVLLGAL